MKVFMIRHGETTANAARIYSGHSAVMLTEEGRSQALAIAPILQQIPFDRVYSSDLRRVIDTQMLAMPNCQVIRTPLLREFDVGILEGKPYGVLPKELVADYQSSKRYAPFGGESVPEVCERVRQFIRILEQDPCENVAVFTHNGVLNCMLQNVLGAEIDRTAVLNNNCAINVYEFTGEKWRLIALNYMAKV